MNRRDFIKGFAAAFGAASVVSPLGAATGEKGYVGLLLHLTCNMWGDWSIPEFRKNPKSISGGGISSKLSLNEENYRRTVDYAVKNGCNMLMLDVGDAVAVRVTRQNHIHARTFAGIADLRVVSRHQTGEDAAFGVDELEHDRIADLDVPRDRLRGERYRHGIVVGRAVNHPRRRLRQERAVLRLDADLDHEVIAIGDVGVVDDAPGERERQQLDRLHHRRPPRQGGQRKDHEQSHAFHLLPPQFPLFE